MTDTKKLVENLYDFSTGLSKSFARTDEEAEDFLQECLIVILQIARQHKNWELQDVIPVCKVSARNRLRNLYKRKKLVEFVPLEQAEMVTISDERERTAKLMLEEILKLVNSREKKLLVYMRDGYSLKEIQEIFRLSKMTLHRDMKNIRQKSQDLN